jgi:hypothetical protein
MVLEVGFSIKIVFFPPSDLLAANKFKPKKYETICQGFLGLIVLFTKTLYTI